jgi:outer membrane biosynthesis protein TonB
MTTQEELVDDYLSAFTEHQRFVMNVAMEKLGSSFNIAKSTGFAKWKAKRELSQQAPAPTPTPTTEQVPTPAPAPEPVQPPDQPKKKRKLVVKRKVTPSKKQQQPVTIADKVTTLLLANNVEQTPTPLILQTSETPSIEHEGGSLYCIFSDTNMLYVGTTSDTKKNFRLAFRNVIKRLKEGEHTLPSTLCAFIHETEDSKQRVKIRDVIKRAFII